MPRESEGIAAVLCVEALEALGVERHRMKVRDKPFLQRKRAKVQLPEYTWIVDPPGTYIL